MRSSSYISFGILFLVLNACSPSNSLTSNSEDQNDDVYFVEASEDKGDETKGPSRSKDEQQVSEKKERPDYYDPKVAEQMQWERLQRRYDPFYTRGLPTERNSYGPYRKTGQRHRIYPTGSAPPQKSGSSGIGDSSDSNDSGTDGGDSKSRDRSYDTDGNSRDR